MTCAKVSYEKRLNHLDRRHSGPCFRKAPVVQLGVLGPSGEEGLLFHLFPVPYPFLSGYLFPTCGNSPETASYLDILFNYKDKRGKDKCIKHHRKPEVIAIPVLFKFVCALVVKPG